jgi:hypothetical protein
MRDRRRNKPTPVCLARPPPPLSTGLLRRGVVRLLQVAVDARFRPTLAGRLLLSSSTYRRYTGRIALRPCTRGVSRLLEHSGPLCRVGDPPGESGSRGGASSSPSGRCGSRPIEHGVAGPGSALSTRGAGAVLASAAQPGARLIRLRIRRASSWSARQRELVERASSPGPAGVRTG